LSTHLRLGLPNSLFPSGFPTNILYAFLFSPLCYMSCPSHPPWLDHPNYVWRGVQVSSGLLGKSRDSTSQQATTISSVLIIVSNHTVSHTMLRNNTERRDVMVSIRISFSEVACSSHGRETGSSDWGFSWFSLIFQGMCPYSTLIQTYATSSS
jgi:hypothetical protein